MAIDTHDLDDMADEVKRDQDEWWPTYDPDVHYHPGEDGDGEYADDSGERGHCALTAAAIFIFGMAACAEGIARLVVG